MLKPDADPGQVRSSALGACSQKTRIAAPTSSADCVSICSIRAFDRVRDPPCARSRTSSPCPTPPLLHGLTDPVPQGRVAHHGRPYDPEEPYHSEPFALNIDAGGGETIDVAHSDYAKADRNRNQQSLSNHAAGARRAQEVWSMAQRKPGGEKTTLGSATDEIVWRRRRWGG